MGRVVLTVVAVVVGLSSGAAQDALGTLRSFDRDPIGVAPPGFIFATARLQATGQWQVKADGPNRLLTHTPIAGAGPGFDIALLDDRAPRDLRLSVRVRLEDGARAGGILWSYHDPDNFYAVSLDLNLQELALYRVARGNRIRLEFDDDLELDRAAWHTLRIEHVDGWIRVALGGIGVAGARVRDGNDGEGRAGVWSAGNAVTSFDDVSVRPAERDRRRNRNDYQDGERDGARGVRR